jgi:hypothetical protein
MKNVLIIKKIEFTASRWLLLLFGDYIRRILSLCHHHKLCFAVPRIFFLHVEMNLLHLLNLNTAMHQCIVDSILFANFSSLRSRHSWWLMRLCLFFIVIQVANYNKFIFFALVCFAIISIVIYFFSLLFFPPYLHDSFIFKITRNTTDEWVKIDIWGKQNQTSEKK